MKAIVLTVASFVDFVLECWESFFAGTFLTAFSAVLTFFCAVVVLAGLPGLLAVDFNTGLAGALFLVDFFGALSAARAVFFAVLFRAGAFFADAFFAGAFFAGAFFAGAFFADAFFADAFFAGALPVLVFLVAFLLIFRVS
ncbi:MAG: hypothetical protein O3B01_17260 [Planctomycetota bacterium]|nr:hypothetical protein [Planctomycetota bacterium]